MGTWALRGSKCSTGVGQVCELLSLSGLLRDLNSGHMVVPLVV